MKMINNYKLQECLFSKKRRVKLLSYKVMCRCTVGYFYLVVLSEGVVGVIFDNIFFQNFK